MTAVPRTAGALLALVAVAAGCAAISPVAGTSSSPASPRETPAKPCRMPIARAALPHDARLLPNAPRAYRGGMHEGVDIFAKESGAVVARGEAVLNACPGRVIRADHTWREMSEDEYSRVTAELKREPNDELLDRVRGRQVWVRRGDGTVLRYCHLDSVAPGIRPGQGIEAGVVLGTVGNSGTSDGSQGTGRNCHLHFEIRTGSGGYLGEGLSPAAARELYAAFLGAP